MIIILTIALAILAALFAAAALLYWVDAANMAESLYFGRMQPADKRNIAALVIAALLLAALAFAAGSRIDAEPARDGGAETGVSEQS